jgi:protein SCO1/2
MLLLTVSVGCNRTRKYPLQGEVVGKNAVTSEITVKHGDIPGFMPAMAMPYRVKDPAVVQELQPGDKIAAEVVIGKDPSDYWLEDVRITDESARVSAKPPAEPSIFQTLPGRRCW